MTATESFWDFSVRTYSQAGVADACLALQDQRGVDVNLLLYCCWAGWRYDALDDETFKRALDFSQTWAERVVRPLRGVRRWMKSRGCANEMVQVDDCMDLRQEIKSAELRAEKLQQAVLESLPRNAQAGGQIPRGPRAVSANLQLYCKAAGIAWSEDVRLKLGVILRAAFPRERVSELMN